MTQPSPDLQDWIGKSETATDLLRAQPARFMQATLDRAPSLSDGDSVPPLWHWLYFLDARPTSELGRDAHPRKGGFLPPVDLPRRMWAGGRFRFHGPLVLGQEAGKCSTIRSVVEKQGRSGRLCFVTVEHELSQNGQLAVTEEHDIVYRDDPAPGDPVPEPAKAPAEAEISEIITPSEVMLFRYSALTFNGHRIHYDADYARKVEGYDGLVFHGPLTATLLVDLACRLHRQVPKTFAFRGTAPLAGMAPFQIEAASTDRGLALWAKRHDGALAMTATAEF